MGKLPSEYLQAILTCGLYYTELLILYTLDYKGHVSPRISDNKYRGGGEVKVPWIQTSEI